MSSSRFLTGLGQAIALGLIIVALVVASPVAQVSGQEASPIPAGAPIMAEDFSDPGSGWDVSTHSGGRSGYDNGEYRVVAEANGVGVRFGFRSEVARDFVAEVDARLPAGKESTAVYLGVRYKSTMGGAPGGYMRLTVSPSARRAVLGVNTWTGTTWTLTPVGEVTDHPSIVPGAAPNRLGFKVHGEAYVAYVNGQELFAVQDATYQDGGLVLGVIGPRGADTEARFDNLTVSELPAE